MTGNAELFARAQGVIPGGVDSPVPAYGSVGGTPRFLVEYAHAMGMGAGDLEPYVQDFYRGDNMLGGCIWEFCDHAAYHADGPVKLNFISSCHN